MDARSSRLQGALLFIAMLTLLCPASPATTLAATPFVNEIVDGTNNVGVYTSLAIDGRGNPHVSYLDDSTDDLKYARKSGGVWSIETADASVNNVGIYSSIALDAQGNPYVSYQDLTTGDLKYARKMGGVWTIEIADGSANLVGSFTSIALDAQGNAHVTYVDATVGDIKYARRIGGVWTIENADAQVNDLGSGTSLALDAQGSPYVTYRDNVTNDLKYARKVGANWVREVADGSANSVGLRSSLVLDAQANPHVSYRDDTAATLKYARKSGGVWIIEVADATPVDKGDYSSIALDATGNILVSYWEGAGRLMYARRSSGSWAIDVADGSSNDVGRYTSLAMDGQGNPHVSYYDATVGDLKYANAAVRLLGPTPGVTWAVGSRQDISWSGLGPVDIYLATDGTSFEVPLEQDIMVTPITIRVPHLPTRFARVRIERASPFSYSVVDSFFRIDATVALAKFDATREDDGTRLTWETNPGPEADIRYRVERGREGAFVSIADGLDRGEFVDASPANASRYRLIAINGLGEEYVLGETSVAPRLAADRDIVAYPNPAGAPVQIAFRVLTDRPLTLDVFDTSGRRVRSLVSGNLPAGVHSATWDRRDESGRDVSAGTYFLRMRSAIGYDVTERVTIVR